MYTDWHANALTVVVTAVAVALAVLVHYEGLRWLLQRLIRQPSERRRKVLFGVYGVLVLHVAEIWLFGSAMWVLQFIPDTGHIRGSLGSGLLDMVYLSAITFTTVGFGDLAPVGPLRFLCGTEALTGFILITWSASFLFLEMQEFWRRK